MIVGLVATRRQRIIGVNEGALEILQVDNDEIIGKQIDEVFQRGFNQQEVQREEANERVWVGPNGKKIRARVYSLFTEDDDLGIIQIELVRRWDTETTSQAIELQDSIVSFFNGVSYQCRIVGGTREFIQIGLAIESMLGYSSERIISDKGLFHSRIFLRDADYVMKRILGAKKKGHAYMLTYRIYDSSGDIRWINDCGFFPDNSAIMNGILFDVTDRINYEETLRQSCERYERILNAFQDLIVIFDKNNCHQDYIASRMDILYCNPEEFIGRNVYDVLPKDVARIIDEALNTTRMTGQSQSVMYELEIQGEKKWFNMITTLHEDGESVVCTIQDVTELEKSRRRILLVESRYERLLNNLNEGLVIMTTEGRIYQHNDTFLQMLGISRNIVGMNIADFMEPDASNQFEEIKSQIAENRVIVHQTELTTGNKKIPVEIRIYGIYDMMIGKQSIWLIVQDITDRIEKERILRSIAETATLYLDVIGHDIRNYLQAVLAGLDIINMQLENSTITETLCIIEHAVERASHLIAKIQATRGLVEEPLQRINCWRVLKEDVERFIQQYPNVIVSEMYETNKAYIEGDRFLHFVFENLLENAVQYNPRDNKRVWISLYEEDEGYTIIIEDNGKGISDDVKKSLMDSMRRFGGIGIHQAKNIVTKYGGHISIRDRVPGESSQGTSFRIWIPKSSGQ